jgi:hypothetical protein
MIECCISVLHWYSVSIPGDRMVIEVHDNGYFLALQEDLGTSPRIV